MHRYKEGNEFGKVNSKYKSAKKLGIEIEKYFNEGLTKKEVLIGVKPYQKVHNIEVPTITGLAYYLGFASRQSFYDYEKRGEFSYIIKRARLRIEQNYEEMLQVGSGQSAGPIFALKNMNWTDKTEMAIGGTEKPISVIVNLGNGMNPDETTK